MREHFQFSKRFQKGDHPLNNFLRRGFVCIIREMQNYTMPIYRTERLIIICSFFPSVHNLNFNSLACIDQIVAYMTIFFFHIIFIILLEIVLELFVI